MFCKTVLDHKKCSHVLNRTVECCHAWCWFETVRQRVHEQTHLKRHCSTTTHTVLLCCTLPCSMPLAWCTPMVTHSHARHHVYVQRLLAAHLFDNDQTLNEDVCAQVASTQLCNAPATSTLKFVISTHAVFTWLCMVSVYYEGIPVLQP
jgi:hypothetical protein